MIRPIFIDVKPGEKLPLHLIPSMQGRSHKNPLREIDRKIIEDAMPGLQSALPQGDAMLTYAPRLRFLISKLSDDISAIYEAKLAVAKELNNHNAETFKKLNEDYERVKLAHQSALAEVKQIQEVRGTYESKKVAALQADITNKERALAEASVEHTRLASEVQALKNEVTARVVQCDGYARDLTQLATAASATAQAMQLAHKHLTDARDNIQDRYPTIVPAFTDAILGDILAARASLPVATQ